MNFLINLFKKAPKGDSYRTTDTHEKYADKISQLNSDSDNQYNRLTTSKINKISKSSKELTPTTTQGTTIPGK